MGTYDGACAYVTDDCYPVWKVQEVDHVESEKGVEAVTLLEGENGILETIDEPQPSIEVEPGPRTGVTDDGSPTVGAEMIMEEYPPVIEDEERPQMTVRAIQAEIERMSGSNRKKLKKWMENIGKRLIVEATEEQSDDWVQAL